MTTEASSNGTRIPLKRAGPPVRGSKKEIKRRRKLKLLTRPEGSHEEVLVKDVEDLLQKTQISSEQDQSATNGAGAADLPEQFTEVELTIEEISSTGEGIAPLPSHPGHAVVVPFTLPTETVVAKLVKHFPEDHYSQADLVRVVHAADARDDALVRCPYFTACSGCQLQMLPYAQQLALKKRTVEKAYANFSGLPAAAVPAVGDTVGSPRQYGYRTKLTPHFDGPPGARRRARAGERAAFEAVPAIGFTQKGRSRTLDVARCPIATDAVQLGLARERRRVADELARFSKGATLLLRESTSRWTMAELAESGIDTAQAVCEDDKDGKIVVKQCVTQHNAQITECVDEFRFSNPASAFFQNNASILPVFTQYIRDHILPAPQRDAGAVSASASAAQLPITNLIDAYCGSGLFTVTLSQLFQTSVGIDISSQSIACAELNAKANGLRLTRAASPSPARFRRVQSSPSPAQSRRRSSSRSPSNPPASAPAADEPAPAPAPAADKDKDKPARSVSFFAADAAQIFQNSATRALDAARTAVVIDPPRKGCDEPFLAQLLAFAPARIVYVSCNVHTQARDVGWLLRGGEGAGDGGTGEQTAAEGPREHKAAYRIESLRGFDFFPQTSHVESVAVLSRIS